MEKYQKILILSILGMIVLYMLFVPLGVNLNFAPEPTSTPVKQVNVSINTTANATTNKTTTAKATAKPTATPNQQKTYTLLFFEQQNCPYCAIMHPLVAAWATSHPRASLSIEQTGSALGNQYGVRAAPTTILIDKSTGQVVKTWVGVFDTAELTTYYNAT
jgi:thioredoxin-related protein